jgi:hypothetical protein
MIPMKDWQPTGFDHKGLGSEEYPDFLVSRFSRTRDASLLENCNFEVALWHLGAYGESNEEFFSHAYCTPDEERVSKINEDDWTYIRQGHWACGWLEIILVREGTLAAEIMEELEAVIENCVPYLDEGILSNREQEALSKEVDEFFDSFDPNQYENLLAEHGYEGYCEIDVAKVDYRDFHEKFSPEYDESISVETQVGPEAFVLYLIQRGLLIEEGADDSDEVDFDEDDSLDEDDEDDDGYGDGYGNGYDNGY